MLKYIFMWMSLIFILKFKKTIFILVFSILVIWSHLNHQGFTSLGYLWGWDLLSENLISLTLFIFILMYLSSNQIWENSMRVKTYHILMMLMLNILILAFSSLNLLFFFLWFEAILIPMFMLIMGWGPQPERFQASLYLMFYTLFGSLPLLVGLIKLNQNNSLSFLHLTYESLSFYSSWNLIFVLAFLMKLPLYLLHYWLPKAHVEAPVSGSMLLAGVLLKLGGYGFYRIFLFLNKNCLNNYLISISLYGAIFTSFLCLRQMDVKSLVAFSSVGHMGLMLAGFLTGFNLSFQGGILMMIAHGFCSSGLFCLMNLYYERVKSRNLLILRGFMSISPSLVFWTFLLMSSNMSCPPSLNLLSEIHLFSAMTFYNMTLAIFLFFIFMLTCSYSLFLYSSLAQGPISSLKSNCPMNLREKLLIFSHWWPINFYFLVINVF